MKWLKSIEPYFPDLHNSQLEFEHHDDHLPQSTGDTLNIAEPVLGKGANEDLLPPCINEVSQNQDLSPQKSDPLQPQKLAVLECSTG